MFGVPNIVRLPYKKDPQRDPNLENYPPGVEDAEQSARPGRCFGDFFCVGLGVTRMLFKAL